MTQGDPLLPNIFNVVVDEVVRHWELLVAGETGGSNYDDREGQMTTGRMIQGRDNGQRRTEEGHAKLTAQEAFFMWTAGW